MSAIEPPARCKCGRMPKLRSRDASGGGISTWVECPGCGARGPKVAGDGREDALALGQWNAGKGRKW